VTGDGVPFIPAALDDLGLDVYAFRLYAHACRRAGNDRRFYGGPLKVARTCRMSLRHFWRAIARLRAAGLLEVIETSEGRPTVYRVNPCPTGTGTRAPQALVGGPPVPHRHTTRAPQAHPPVPGRHTEGTPLKVPPEGTPVPPPPAGAVVRGGWPARLALVWRAHGDVSEGRIGKALGGVVKTHGPERTEAGLRRWLEAGNARFGPECFARDAVSWITGNGPPQNRRGLSRAERIDAKVAARLERANANQGGDDAGPVIDVFARKVDP